MMMFLCLKPIVPGINKSLTQSMRLCVAYPRVPPSLFCLHILRPCPFPASNTSLQSVPKHLFNT